MRNNHLESLEHYTIDPDVNYLHDEESKHHNDGPVQIISPMFLDLSGNENNG